MPRKKSFYSKKITFYLAEDILEILREIPNQSQFIRDAISEKLSTINSKDGGKNEEDTRNIEENS